MKTLLILTVILISVTSCGPNSSPEKRMKSKNHELERKIALLAKQQQILRDSIFMMDKKLEQH